VAVLSSGRQDWGILRSTCVELQRELDFDLRLILGGDHCSVRQAGTRAFVEQDGFGVCEALDWLGDGDAPATRAGRATELVGRALARQAPDALMLVGDRFETLAAALAATLQRVPLVHLHGGEETEGAFDNGMRHAITKLSHLHLVSHPKHADRVRQMGEDPACVHVVGAPGLDNAHRSDLPGREEIEARLGLKLAPPVVLVTVHPTTLASDPAADARAVVAAMAGVTATYVVTMPNPDPGAEEVRALLSRAASAERSTSVEALGDRAYWGLLRASDLVLGNSSSALIEAPLVGLPAVNVGDRQKGRLRGANVIDVPPERSAVSDAVHRALDPAFRQALRGSSSPYGDGHSAARIVRALRGWEPSRPPRKAFVGYA